MPKGLGAITFSEFHLFPRVVFAIGAALLAGAIINQRVAVGTAGAGIVFVAVSYNTFLNLFLIPKRPDSESDIKYRRERRAFQFHAILSLLLAAYCFYAAVRLHACKPLFPFCYFR